MANETSTPFMEGEKSKCLVLSFPAKKKSLYQGYKKYATLKKLFLPTGFKAKDTLKRQQMIKQKTESTLA